MVVDVGGGTTEVAVISLGGIVVSRSLRVGGYDLDDAITTHIRLEHRMAIGSQSAEAIKLAVGSAMPLDEELSTAVRGRDLLVRPPARARRSTSEEVRARDRRRRWPTSWPRSTTRSRRRRRSWPPTSRATGSCWRAAARCCADSTSASRRETGMPVRLADAPLTCVAIGAGQSLEELDALSSGRR